jgi:hypothetical protein
VRYCLDLPNWATIAGRWLYDWQTLISGVLAISAAAVSVWMLHRQISQAEAFRRDELSRRHAAARVALPISLAAVSSMVSEIVGNIAAAIESSDDPDFETAFNDAARDKSEPELVRVALDSSVLSSFQGFVETLHNESEIRHIAEMISSIQVLLARYNDFDMSVVNRVDGFYGILLDASKVAMLNDAVYNYSRFVDGSSFSLVNGKPNSEIWDIIHRKSHSAIFRRRSPDVFFAKIAERIEGYKKRDASPWLEKFQA